MKLLDYTTVQQLTYGDAKAYCKERYNANLISIGNKGKQKYLERFLQYQEVNSNIWIGLEHHKGAIYKWSDGTKFTYKNWAPGSPKNQSQYCVQMELFNEKNYGIWSDVLCTLKNVVLCEKKQLRSRLHLQKMVMSMISKQIIPTGFIYFQLPYQKPPTEIWPSLAWKDVSARYAGVFFRVRGSSSGSFGEVQDEYVPKLNKVEANYFYQPSMDCGSKFQCKHVKVEIDKVSSFFFTGTWPALIINEYRTLQFEYSGGEVRPRNMAMRVWEKIEN